MAAELHVHLEGCVEPETVGLARVPFHDFAGFLQAYKGIVRQLRAPEDYARITRAMLNRFIADSIDYAEVTLSAGVVLWQKQDLHKTYSAIREVCTSCPEVKVKWCFDAVRQFGADAATEVVEIAGEFRADGVVSFGIGGDEAAAPAGMFDQVFALANRRGLRLTAHAGEAAGAESVWAALRIGAERIGHGIRAIEDASLLRHLRDQQIPLEVCITSNVATGVVASLADHPVRRLFDAGVPITLNTDDPALFETSLDREFGIAREVFGFSEEELEQVAANAYRFAF